MPWLIKQDNKKKSKAKTKKTEKKVVSKESKNRARNLMIAKAVFVLVAVTCVGILWYQGRTVLKEKVAIQKQQKIEVSLRSIPTWMNETWQKELLDIIAENAGSNPLDHQALNKIASTLQVNPWVKRVRSVKRQSDGQIIADLEYRHPVALVTNEDTNRFYMIDIDQTLLPASYSKREAIKSPLPMISHAAYTRPTFPGHQWQGKDITAGMKLAALIRKENLEHQIIMINVANYDGRSAMREPHLKLVTRNGEVYWGRVRDSIYEPKNIDKLRLLKEVITRPGRYDLSRDTTSTAGRRTQVPHRTINQ